MEVIVLLKLEVDTKQLKKEAETDEHIKSKIRAFVADVVAHAVADQELITVLSSSLAAEIEPKGTVQIVPSNPVLRLPPGTKVQ